MEPVFKPILVNVEGDIPANAKIGEVYHVKEGPLYIVILPNGDRFKIVGGSGDPHDKGMHPSLAELKAAYPTGSAGDYAKVVNETENQLYTWSDAANDWAPSGVSGSYVESVNGKQGPNVTLGATDVGAVPAAQTVKFSGENNDVDLTGKGNVILDGASELLGTNPDGTHYVKGLKLSPVPEGGFTDENPPDFTDDARATSPKYFEKALLWWEAPKRPKAFGICETGIRTENNGSALSWIDGDFNIVETVTDDYFYTHPSYKFDPMMAGANYFNKVPIAYWKRGEMPSGHDYENGFYMLLSPEEAEGFSANGAVYNLGGVLKPYFLYGTYRAFNNGGVPGSQPGKTHWGNVSFDALKAAALSMGDGHHMTTLQEYHEIIARAVIEKKTFNLWPESVRKSRDLTNYRGIEEIVFDGYSDSGGNTYAEWQDGIYIDASGNFWALKDDGTREYINTDITIVKAAASNYIETLLSGGLWDHMFVAKTQAPSNFMIPDHTNLVVKGVCRTVFAASVSGGAFFSNWNSTSSEKNVTIGARLAKHAA